MRRSRLCESLRIKSTSFSNGAILSPLGALRSCRTYALAFQLIPSPPASSRRPPSGLRSTSARSRSRPAAPRTRQRLPTTRAGMPHRGNQEGLTDLSSRASSVFHGPHRRAVGLGPQLAPLALQDVHLPLARPARDRRAHLGKLLPRLQQQRVDAKH